MGKAVASNGLKGADCHCFSGQFRTNPLLYGWLLVSDPRPITSTISDILLYDTSWLHSFSSSIFQSGWFVYAAHALYHSGKLLP